MKSQSAIEFLSIIALGMIMLALTTFLGYNYVSGYFFDTNGLNAKQTVSITTSAANLVYSQGINASTKITVNLPNDLVQNRTYTYDKEMNLRFSEPWRDAVGYSAAPLYGTIPLKPGSNVLYLKMTTNGVKLGVDDDVSFVGVRTYNDSNRKNEDSIFSVTNTVYYQVKLEHLNGTYVNSNMEINYYYPNGTIISSSSASTTNGVYNGTITISGNTYGFRLISVLIPDEKIIGTSLFNVTS